MKCEIMFKDFLYLENGSFDLEEALKRQKLKFESVESLREMSKRSPLVPRFIHDKQLLLFINACDNDLEKSSKWLHLFYKMKRNTPEFFKNRDVFADDVQTALENQIYATLPVTPSNHNVVFHRLSNTNPKTYDFDASIKTFIMSAEASTFRNGPRDGTIFLYDFAGGKLRHLIRPKINSIKKALEFLQYGSPLNVVEIHIFNIPYFMDVVYTMIRPFVRKELYDRIYLHQSNLNFEEFFTKFIPRSHMPSDYGGDLPSIEELHVKNRNLLIEMRGYFMFEENQTNFKYEDLAVETAVSDDEGSFMDAKDE